MQRPANRNSPHPGRPRAERGYMLIVFVMFAAVLLVGVYRILPKYVFEGQRQKEEELIFRGQQYRRAIQLFVRKFGRYPNSLEELEDTNQIRFIRKLYPDPVTPDGEWRLIHIGPGGAFVDALNQPAPPPKTAGTLPVSSPGTRLPQSGTSPAGSPSPVVAPQNPSGAPRPGLSPFPSPQGPSSGDPATSATATPGPNPSQPRASGILSQQLTSPQVFGDGGIAGVASKNEGGSIKRWNNYEHYNEWEFIYDYRSDPLGLAAVTRVSGGGAQQGQQGQPAAGQAPGSPGQSPGGQQRPPLGLPPVGGRPPGFPGIPGGTPFPGIIPGVPGPFPGVPNNPNAPRVGPPPEQR